MPSIADVPISSVNQKRDITHESTLAPVWKKMRDASSDVNVSECPSGHFDLTSLRPLPIPSTVNTKDKFIQLYCKGRKEIVCCFRGNRHAAFALNIDTALIKPMCQKKRKAPVFPNFELSYSPNDKLSSYYFGGHLEDYKIFPETYVERLERFRKTFDAEKKRWDEEITSTNEVPLSMLPDFKTETETDTAMKDLKVASIKSEKHLINNRNNFQNLCIICQDTRAEMVFEPCKHAVLCETCFSKGFCKKFCPTCRTPLLSTTKPMKIRFVRPRVFSAYSILHDDN